jgi:hypothetical protein
LQHIDNNHPDATAKDPQNAMSQHCRTSEAADASVGQLACQPDSARRPVVVGTSHGTDHNGHNRRQAPQPPGSVHAGMFRRDQVAR